MCIVDGPWQLRQILLGPKPFSCEGLGGGAVWVLHLQRKLSGISSLAISTHV